MSGVHHEQIIRETAKWRKNNNGKAENFEKTLFKAADKLRKDIDADGYKPIGK